MINKVTALRLPKNSLARLNPAVNEDTSGVSEVKSIKLITPLDDGSANDGTGTKTKKGMIHGKNYTFKVTEYFGKRPSNLSKINWELTYYDLDDSEWKTLPISGKGESITMNMGNLDTCGRDLYIRAYIDDENNDAILKVWKHNRFRWFDGKIFDGELKKD